MSTEIRPPRTVLPAYGPNRRRCPASPRAIATPDRRPVPLDPVRRFVPQLDVVEAVAVARNRDVDEIGVILQSDRLRQGVENPSERRRGVKEVRQDLRAGPPERGEEPVVPPVTVGADEIGRRDRCAQVPDAEPDEDLQRRLDALVIHEVEPLHEAHLLRQPLERPAPDGIGSLHREPRQVCARLQVRESPSGLSRLGRLVAALYRARCRSRVRLPSGLGRWGVGALLYGGRDLLSRWFNPIALLNPASSAGMITRSAARA
jgi:hypothetical protein